VTESQYAFGDSDLARERLALVASTFAPPTRALLAEISPRLTVGYVLDMGCGPGHLTALLVDAYPHAYVTGIDASEAMVTEARTRVPGAQFVVADVTAPLPLPAHVVFARLLLGHLPEPAAALENWAAALRLGGVLVCEEPVRYRSELDAFARYEEAVTAVVNAGGATLWASPALDRDPPQCERAIDRVVEHPVPVTTAAAMFWRNAVAWGGDEDLIDELRALEESAPAAEIVMWELRQTVWVKRPG
jgi:SAM-dependent methyltransferase